MKSIDPRILRTREFIVKALIELCEERDFSGLTITAVTARAGVNRATFYRHFENLKDAAERGSVLILNDIHGVD